MKLKYHIGICTLLIIGSSFVTPGDPIPALRVLLTKYYSLYPKEKVYLHSDKQNYSAGETIWFNGYVTRQAKPFSASGILYLELFNDKGLVINRMMRPVEDGSFRGDLLLPSTMNAGNYYIRAYTSWMLNFSSSMFYYKKIYVESTGKSKPRNTTADKSNFSVQFFPESGQLVNRLTSLVVFKAIDSNGIPVAVSGKVINNLGDTVAILKTIHDGMGSFVIHCSPQTIYTALITANGQTKRFPLPASKSEGIVLHTETRNTSLTDSVFFHISRTKEHKEKYQNLLLCARMENHVSITKIHFDELTFNDPLDTLLSAPYPLLLNNFGPGVLQLSVLTEDSMVLGDRLIFLHDYRRSSAEIKSVQHNPGQGKTSFSINLPDAYQGKVAISVTDTESVFDTLKADNILSGLLLSAETESDLVLPAWYLTRQAGETRALDMLMITAKPAGFNLEKLLHSKQPEVRYTLEKSITMKGRAFEINGDKKTPLMNGSVFLIMKALKDSLSIPMHAFTDSTGHFIFNDLYFHDTAIVYLQTGVKSQGGTTNKIAIEFDKSIIDSIYKTPFVIAPALLNPGFNTHESTAEYLSGEHAGEKMLTNVTITARGKTHTDSTIAKYASGIFASPGAWAVTLDLTTDEVTKNMDVNVLEYLNGKVAGLLYAYDKGLPIIYWRFSNIIDGLSAMDQLKLNSPSFFLNESLLNTGNEGYDGMVQVLSGIRIADVVMIRIYKPGTLQNVPDNGPHGAIAIYLKNGTEDTRTPAKVVFEQFLKSGFSAEHNFETSAKNHGTSTLYWNPGASPEPLTHNIFVSFNNGNRKRLRVVAEGLDKNGNVIQLDKIIE